MVCKRWKLTLYLKLYRFVRTAHTSLNGRFDQSNITWASLGRIQQRCNYSVETIRAETSVTVYSQVRIGVTE